VLLCLCSVGVAHAYEDQITLGVGAGYAYGVSDSPPNHAALLDLSVSAGLSAEFSVRTRLSYALFPASEPEHALLLGGELLYLVDVVEFVPYLGLGLDGFGRLRAGATDLDAATHLVLGVDYLISRDLTLGIDLRPHLVFTDLAREPVVVALTVSAIWMFDR
jgi:hypothetical protein